MHTSRHSGTTSLMIFALSIMKSLSNSILEAGLENISAVNCWSRTELAYHSFQSHLEREEDMTLIAFNAVGVATVCRYRFSIFDSGIF